MLIRTGGERGRRGSATLIALLSVVAILGITGAVISVGMREQGERRGSVADEKARDVARAGVAHAVARLYADETGDIGTPDAPVGFGGGAYWVDVEDLGNGFFSATSEGTADRHTHAVEAVIQAIEGGIYDNAIFAGNTSGDADYALELGGLGTQADYVDGDIYSGEDVLMEGAATVTGTIRAQDAILGATGETQVSQPVPDLKAMDYAGTADIDVAALFDSGEYWSSDSAGGSAYQMPESSPAHIFRKNPTDRVSDTSSTVKDDFFLEDPYESVSADYGKDGSNPYEFTLSGVSGEPGEDSNHKVFYIDGNLWVHNKKTYSLALGHDEPDGVQITIVVSGNIYLADNLFYEDADVDGIALIAMVDEDVEDSGNIYFGDPAFGTLQQMNAFMYAENNFYDLNLDQSGSAHVTLNGNMTAGNHVEVERDYGSSHTKLSVHFDDRISTGELEMPNLPLGGGQDGAEYLVVSWRRVGLQ